MTNDMINNVAEAAVEAVAQNAEVVKTVGTKTVVLFGTGCMAVGVLADELVRFIVKKCNSKKDIDLEKSAKKGFKLFKRKVRDTSEVVADAVEDAVDDVKDLLEEK